MPTSTPGERDPRIPVGLVGWVPQDSKCVCLCVFLFDVSVRACVWVACLCVSVFVWRKCT